MSDEREKNAADLPGAPVEEQAAGEDAVKEAVDRAAAEATLDRSASDAAVRDAVADAAVDADPVDDASPDDASASEAAAAAKADLGDLGAGSTPLIADDLPSAAAEPEPVPVLAAPAAESPVRDGEIRISADHPMAALYMQSPMPPDLKGNRGAGVLIALLGTIAFGVLYAGVIAIWLAPQYPPSTFLSEGLVPWVTSWGFIAGVIAFFVGLSILVLVFGRAGWWAYVLFSLFVGFAVWGASSGMFALLGTPIEDVDMLGGGTGVSGLLGRMGNVGFGVATLGAAILAREVAVWFGAWIGRRGRRVTARNAELLAEYEAALAEVRAQQ